MSLPDKAMGHFFRLVTRWTPHEISHLEQSLAESRLHPRDLKMKLAYEIVSIYHDEAAAQRAQDNFVRVFQRGDLPEEMPELVLSDGQTVLDVLVAGKLVNSKSEGRRLLEQNGVRLDGEVLTDPNLPFPKPGVLQVGKRKYLKVINN
jgi:tyrosyl-tRNA synthetase